MSYAKVATYGTAELSVFRSISTSPTAAGQIAELFPCSGS